MNSAILSPEEFQKIYSRVPRLCIDLVIQMQGGILLMLRSLPTWNGTWHLPGGTVRYKETIEQATARVAEEEVHLSVNVVRSLGYMEFPSEEKERGFGWAVSIPLLCVPTVTEFKAGKDASEVKVFTELPEIMIPEQKAFLSAHWAEIHNS